MKGITQIELKNVVTGETQLYQEENMITEAVTDLLRALPMYYQHSEIEKNFVPLWEKAMGGIVLFDATIEEQTNSYYEPYGVNKVGYASAGASNLTDPKRGSRNTIESQILTNGVKMVWDFTTAQANGTIKSICLTSTEGGEGEYGSVSGQIKTNTRFITKNTISSSESNAITVSYCLVSVEEDAINKVPQLISITQEIATIKLRKHTIPLGIVSMTNKSLTYGVCDESETVAVTFKNAESLAANYLSFVDGGDGYWYGFYTPGNRIGNGKLYVVKIKKESYEITDLGYQTLTGCALVSINSYSMVFLPVISNGYVYLSKFDTTLSSSYNYYYGTETVYKVNLSNFTDIVEIVTGERFSRGANYIASARLPNGSVVYNDRIIHPDNSCMVMPTLSSTYSWFFDDYYFNYPLICYKTFLFTLGEYKRCMMAINPYYLASINNLDTPITKTADKTMKITYTLTYE